MRTAQVRRPPEVTIQVEDQTIAAMERPVVDLLQPAGRARCGVALLAIVTSGLGACRTPSVYEVRCRRSSDVSVILEESSGKRAVQSLAAGQRGTGVSLRVDPIDVARGLLQAKGYSAHASRGDGGGLVLRFRPDAGISTDRPLVGPEGRLLIDFPTATGDLFHSPGIHQQGVTAIGAHGPLSQENGNLGLHFTYRPDYSTQQALGRRAAVDVTLLTPMANVASVVRREKPPRGALGFMLGISASILAGGTFIAIPRDDDSSRAGNLRLSIGLPLLAVSLVSGTWAAVMLGRGDRSVSIPLEDARGAP